MFRIIAIFCGTLKVYDEVSHELRGYFIVPKVRLVACKKYGKVGKICVNITEKKKKHNWAEVQK